MTIRLRLTLLYTGLLAAVLTLFSIGLFFTLRFSLLQQIDRQLIAREQEMRGEVLIELAQQRGLSNQMLRQLLQQDNAELSSPGVFVELYEPESRTVFRSPSLGSLDMAFGGLEGQESLTLDTVGVEGERVRLLSAPVVVGGQQLLIIRVGQSLVPLDSTLERLALLLASGTVLTTLIAAWAGLRVAGRALAPVASMSERARKIVETQELGTRLPVANPEDELGQLALTFNDALEQIESLFQAQRRFVADAAHELRTPLTSIRGHTDLLRRGAADSPSAREEALSVIDSEAARLTRLVNDLLLLAQTEATPLEIMREPVPLAGVVADVLRQERLLAPEHSWHFWRRASPIILGDADRLFQLCLNLLDNARRHTPHGSRIEIELSEEVEQSGQATARLTIADDGPGIPESQLRHLFEPFFRGDRPRSRGAGLGLAIVSRVAAAHGGTVAVANRAGGGALFTVHLPAIRLDERLDDTPEEG